ncbi:hypothetical protein [Helicobacter suis]|uniref:hypothetical protein n=1 Tax=Helicobacter suis TaxID=104628 RepID=UPI0013D18AD5|nr:hypothetical protein [Helicobacter suis]
MTRYEAENYVNGRVVDGMVKCFKDSFYQAKYGVLPEVKLNQMEDSMRIVNNSQDQTAKVLVKLNRELKALRHELNHVKKSFRHKNRRLAKFPLLCDGQRITSLEQLKEHFNLLDVLEHYKTGRLQRWLRSRGLTSQLKSIEAINAPQDTEILSALCLVFEIEADKQMIQEVLESYKSSTE